MKLPENGQLLRIFIGENDTCNGHPLFEEIVLQARKLNLAGATVSERHHGIWSRLAHSYSKNIAPFG